MAGVVPLNVGVIEYNLWAAAVLLSPDLTCLCTQYAQSVEQIFKSVLEWNIWEDLLGRGGQFCGYFAGKQYCNEQVIVLHRRSLWLKLDFQHSEVNGQLFSAV